MTHPNTHPITRWAAELLAVPLAVLDTETTGFDRLAQAVSLAAVDAAGTVLLDTRIRPTVLISPGATAVHGITDADAAHAPTLAELAGAITAALRGRVVAVYNHPFDQRCLLAGIEAHGRPPAAFTPAPGTVLPVLFGIPLWVDVMRPYAQLAGKARLPLPDGDHTALGDARATLRLIRRLAGQPEETL